MVVGIREHFLRFGPSVYRWFRGVLGGFRDKGALFAFRAFCAAGSKALLAMYEAHPAGSEAHPASSTAHLAPSAAMTPLSWTH